MSRLIDFLPLVLNIFNFSAHVLTLGNAAFPRVATGRCLPTSAQGFIH